MFRNRRLLQRHLVAALFVGLTVTVATATNTTPDDSTILAELRPATNSDVEMVLTRTGTASYIDTSNLPDTAQVAMVEPPAPPPRPPSVKKPLPDAVKVVHPKVAAVAKGSPKPKAAESLRPKLAVKPTAHPQVALVTPRPAPPSAAPPSEAPPTLKPLPVVTLNEAPTTVVLAKPSAAATLRSAPDMVVPTVKPATPKPVTQVRPKVVPITVAKQVPAPPPFIVADTRYFQPPAEVPKPSNSPTPMPTPKHDAKWLQDHRFDTPDDDVPIPGVPVRSQASSPFGRDSGAFHGVRSRNGYSAVRVVVSIPCGDAKFETAPGFNPVADRPGQVDVETGFIYIGGWGAGDYGVAVDAGLQKSSAQSATDDYAFYWKFAGNQPFTVSNQNRFPCGGPDVTLEIYPASNDLLVFSAHGQTEDGVMRTLTAIQHTKPSDGWVPGGGSADNGIILKRIVSIAQPPQWTNDSTWSNRRWRSGTYFGIGGPTDPTPKIAWKKCFIGRVTPPNIRPVYHDWTDEDTWHSPPGSYTDWPPADVKKASHGYCDDVGLYLHG